MVESSRILLAFFLALLAASALGEQRTFPIAGFSSAYRATVSIEDSEEVFRPGAVSVFDRRSGKRLIHVESDELVLSLRDGEATANIKQLPYGEQSVLIHEDFNFDGRKDLAIMDGQNSCYHGPSFRIYLAIAGGFRYNAALTELAQNNCGLFQVDRAARRLETMTKSGCCWHQFNTYAVTGNRPRLLRSVAESVDMPLVHYRQLAVSEGRRRQIRYFLAPEMKPLFAFKLQKSGKRVELFVDNDQLDYALLRGEREVEFSYALDVMGYRASRLRAEPVPFVRNEEATRLAFRNGRYRYAVHDAPGRLGVSVFRDGRQLAFLAGDPGSRVGSLAQVAALARPPENLKTAAGLP